jgi:hypothetical protein
MIATFTATTGSTKQNFDMLSIETFQRRKLVQKGLGKARVAVAGKLGIRLWIMLRDHSIMKSSVVVDRSPAVPPVRGCLERSR